MSTRRPGWIRRHKVMTGLIAVLLVGSCAALVDNAEVPESDTGEAALKRTQAPYSPEPTPTQTVEPTQAVETASATLEPVLTSEQVWQEKLDEDQTAVIVPLAAALGAKRAVVRDNLDGALDVCSRAEDGKSLKHRVAKFSASMGDAATNVTTDQAAAAMGVLIDRVCPEVSELHGAQVDQRAEKIRVAQEKARKARLQKERERAREAKRKAAAAEARAERQRELAASVYYANCTAARAAGGAPVYAGQPGYGRHLDRDGDGVGCE